LRSTSLTYTGSWSTLIRSDFYGGVMKSTTSKNAQAKRTSLKAERLYLIATKCNYCGTVQVRWNNVVIGTVNLYNASTVKKQAILLKNFGSLQSGTLTLIVTSSGKSVIIEGLGAWKD
jgi:hypothetical protein